MVKGWQLSRGTTWVGPETHPTTLRTSQITEPPIVSTLLKRREPAAKRIERDYNREPDGIDAI